MVSDDSINSDCSLYKLFTTPVVLFKQLHAFLIVIVPLELTRFSTNRIDISKEDGFDGQQILLLLASMHNVSEGFPHHIIVICRKARI